MMEKAGSKVPERVALAMWKAPDHLLVLSSMEQEHHSPGPLSGEVPGSMAVTPALEKLKQMDYFEFEAKLGYKVSARPARTTELCQKQNKTPKSGAESGDPGDIELKESMIIWAGWPSMSSFPTRLTKKKTC